MQEARESFREILGRDYLAISRINDVCIVIQCFICLSFHLCTSCFITDEFSMQIAMHKFSVKVVENIAKLEDEINNYKHQVTCYAHYFSLTDTKVGETETKYTNARLECNKLKEEVEELRAKPCKLQMLVKMIRDKECECIKLKQQVEELKRV